MLLLAFFGVFWDGLFDRAWRDGLPGRTLHHEWQLFHWPV